MERGRRELSPRQQQIIGLVALGLSDKEIGARLVLSPHTVRTYLDRVYQQLGCNTRAHAVALWINRALRDGSLEEVS